MAGLVLSIAVLATGSIAPALATKNLDCDAREVTKRLRCSGGQPAVTDTIILTVSSTGSECSGTISKVFNYDTLKDRQGRVEVSWEPSCDGLTDHQVAIGVI